MPYSHSTDLFQAEWINRLTKTNSLLAIRVYTSASVLIFGWGCYELTLPWSERALWLFVGLAAFTLIEYLMHRYVYHSGVDYLSQESWQFKVHGIHHKHPLDSEILAMPIPLALIVSALLYGVVWLITPGLVNIIFPGLLSGYSVYLYIHYKVHTSAPPRNVLSYLWTHHHLHHHLHHHVDDTRAFGLTSPLWDIVFGTMPNRDARLKRGDDNFRHR